MPRMRVPRAAIEQLKKEDPENCLTLCALRALIKRGQVPVVHVGTRQLLNYDALLEFLSNPVTESSSVAESAGIRRVELKQ